MGPRGDAIAQLDWCVGEIMKKLDGLKLTDNTLVIFSSDNGPVVDDGYKDQAVAKLGDHKPAGPWRGGKYSNFEGGTRVPFIARWPNRIKPGVSDALMCQVDFPATFAALAGRKEALPEAALPDSLELSAALCGESMQGRAVLVEHANQLSLRAGAWKFIPANNGPKKQATTGTELGNDVAGQLFNLQDDPGETKNLIKTQQDRAAKMAAELQKIREAKRTR
jgi:arylsulfatase A-like enzyme